MATYKTSKAEEEMAEKWFAEHRKICRYSEIGRTIVISGNREYKATRTYNFTRTAVGLIKEISCACGERASITDRL
jgi:hypothetical protein